MNSQPSPQGPRPQAQGPTNLLVKLNGHPLGRFATAAGVMGLTMQSYQYLNRTLTPRYDLMLSLDHAIPFLPWTMVIYQIHYIGLLVAAVVVPAREFLRLLAAILVANVVCYAGFILWTSHYPRPEVESIEPACWQPFFAWLYGEDGPGNTFPSIHVTLTILVAMRLVKHAGGWIWWVWAVLVCISTVTVKQHFVLDVAGGVVVALGVYMLFFRGESGPIASEES